MTAAASSPLQPDRWRHLLTDVPATTPTTASTATRTSPYDLAPALTEGLLLALRRAGIAAYAAPTPRRRPGRRPTTDRVWVEVWGRGRAEDVARAELSSWWPPTV